MFMVRQIPGLKTIFDSNMIRLSSKINSNEVSRCSLGEICPSADPQRHILYVTAVSGLSETAVMTLKLDNIDLDTDHCVTKAA